MRGETKRVTLRFVARPKNPLLFKNRNAKFSGAQIARMVADGTITLAASKRARVVRDRSEFDLGMLQRMIRTPFVSGATPYSWAIEDIVAARNAQMNGNFSRPARLSEAFGTDGALFTARQVRLAPVQSLSVNVIAGKSGKGDTIADEADALFGNRGIAISSETETTLRTHLVDHGVAFGALTWTPRADGSRWDVVLNAWPIEFVQWDPICGIYVTRVDPTSSPVPSSFATKRVLNMQQQPDGSWAYDGTSSNPYAGSLLCSSFMEPIIHGNGRWVVFSKSEITPHRFDAALLPAALIWPARAFAMRDWRKGSASHGNAKVIGEAPDGMPLSDENGNPTQEALAFMELLGAIASQDAPYGIRPFGSKTDLLANPSGMWEVFAKLAETSDRDAARIYLGTDGILGAVGGAPGIDISQLFGVATSKIQSDLACLQRGLQSGLIAPWTAVNFGTDKLAPTREYVFPDPDESRVREDFAKRNAAFNSDVKSYRENGFVVDQALVDDLASRHGVPAPKLPVETAKAPSIALAPTDVAKVTKVNEARAAAGTGPLLDATGQPDPRGDKLLSELDAPAAPATPPPA